MTKSIGAVLSSLITLLIIFFAFNRHILDANNISFAAGGDGLKSTFCTLFHIEYDTSYWYTHSMNHPYGESIFFTDSQPFQTNLIKALKNTRLDISDYTVGILNIWLLFSFVFCTLFLYLILIELKLPSWYALLGSVIITFLIPHAFIQLIIPFIIFSIFSGMYDPNTDRTQYPCGFPYTSTRLESVFLPLGKPYGNFIHIRGDLRTVGYIGLVSTLTFIATFVIFIRKWIKEGLSRAFSLTDNLILNLLFLAGFISLLISLGFPFTLGMTRLMNYMGPLRQFRTIGRFIFPFFYIINVYTLYILWKWYGQSSKKRIAMLILSIALIWMSYDAFLNIRHKPRMHYNRYPARNDRENSLPENNWVKNHNWNDYQAIMPFPYFHIGSENYWTNGDSPVIDHAFIASLKTGLPLNAVMLSRTSISQTLNNLDLYYEPCREYPVLKDLETTKPYLLIRCKDCSLTDNEWRLINKSVFRVMIMCDNDRGLIEFPVDIKSADDMFRLTLYNRYVIRGTMKINNILVRRDGDNIEVHDGEKVLVNDRNIYN